MPNLAANDYGVTFGMAPMQARSKPVVQRLFEAGIPGSAYWIYDSAFGMTLNAGPAERQGSATSWAAAEAWLAGAENGPPG